MLAVANRVPPGANCAWRMIPPWRTDAMGLPVDDSNSRAMLSVVPTPSRRMTTWLVVSTYLPSGLKTISPMIPGCSKAAVTGRPAATSHTCASPPVVFLPLGKEELAARGGESKAVGAKDGSPNLESMR